MFSLKKIKVFFIYLLLTIVFFYFLLKILFLLFIYYITIKKYLITEIINYNQYISKYFLNMISINNK